MNAQIFPVNQDIACYLESLKNKQDDHEIFRKSSRVTGNLGYIWRMKSLGAGDTLGLKIGLKVFTDAPTGFRLFLSHAIKCVVFTRSFVELFLQ